jgi:hypothetical protein
MLKFGWDFNLPVLEFIGASLLVVTAVAFVGYLLGGCDGIGWAFALAIGAFVLFLFATAP